MRLYLSHVDDHFKHSFDRVLTLRNMRSAFSETCDNSQNSIFEGITFFISQHLEIKTAKEIFSKGKITPN